MTDIVAGRCGGKRWLEPNRRFSRDENQKVQRRRCAAYRCRARKISLLRPLAYSGYGVCSGCECVPRRRKPIKFAVEQWLTRENDIPTMLPKGAAALDTRTIAERDEWFGLNGNFPAVGVTDERLEHHA
jgi:hypothetical protein